MLRTLYRTLIVLLAMGIVVAGLYGLSTTSLGTSMASSSHRPMPSMTTSTSTDGETTTLSAPASRPEGGEGGEGGAGITQGLLGSVVNILKIAVVVVGVSLLRKGLTRFTNLRAQKSMTGA